jgi:oxidase EvaA
VEASKEYHFLVSALTKFNSAGETRDIVGWLKERAEKSRMTVERIPFSEMRKWHFEDHTGNLAHDSGKFFSIEGISVETNFGSKPRWMQPIINQPEIGILGILAKKFDGVLHFLMQAKGEPGNINTVQIAPTLQATRSNYTGAHGGKSPPYLEYFRQRGGKTLLDTLQSEQGARYLRKRNRNLIIQTSENVEVLPDYCWLTLGQIYELMKLDNVVNMDARSVLGTISLDVPELHGVPIGEQVAAIRKVDSVAAKHVPLDVDPFTEHVIASELSTCKPVHDVDAIVSWMTELKSQTRLDVCPMPLKQVANWTIGTHEISHDDKRFFSVIAVSVEAGNREVSSWTQPIIKPQQEGLVAFVTKEIDGVLNLLVQAKVEPGNLDLLEMAPTIQCLTGSIRDAAAEDLPPLLSWALESPVDCFESSTMQSEEGGRFFLEQNRNLIIKAGDRTHAEIPDNYIWMTVGQVKTFTKYNNHVNAQARCLMMGLGFTRAQG